MRLARLATRALSACATGVETAAALALAFGLTSAADAQEARSGPPQAPLVFAVVDGDEAQYSALAVEEEDIEALQPDLYEAMARHVRDRRGWGVRVLEEGPVVANESPNPPLGARYSRDVLVQLLDAAPQPPGPRDLSVEEIEALADAGRDEPGTH